MQPLEALSGLRKFGDDCELTKRGHHFFGEQTHRSENLGMRDAAEVEGSRERVKEVMLHCILNVLNALLGIAVVVAAGGKHHVPIVFCRRSRQ
jgi:hypothetical protein